MAGSLNKVTLIGNLGRDPEIRTMQNGNRVASFSIATSESWKDSSGNRQERTEWHRIAVFSKGLIGVIEQYIKKGSKIYIEGQLQTRKWQDQSGQDRYTTEIVLQNFSSQLIMLDSRGQSGGGGGGYASQPEGFSNDESQAPAQNDYSTSNDLDDEIPF